MTDDVTLRTPTEVEESTPIGRREMTVARLTLRVALLLSRAHIASGMTQKDLAESLGLTEGRVSQVLNGDGNIKISTLARFMTALGYESKLDALPLIEGLPDISQKRRSRRSSHELKESVYLQLVGGTNGGVTHRITIVPDGTPASGSAISDLILLGTVDVNRSSVKLSGASVPNFAIGAAR